MSRIGKMPINIPEGVSVTINGTHITVSGKLGTLERDIDRNIFLELNGNVLNISRKSEEKSIKAKHGLTRALVFNMVTGVSQGFTKKLIVKGVGYKLSVQGAKLVLNLGYSHPIEIETPKGIEFTTNGKDEIVVKGIDKELVGSISAKIKGLRPVEPYHNYGIHYAGERVIKKQGKTGKK